MKNADKTETFFESNYPDRLNECLKRQPSFFRICHIQKNITHYVIHTGLFKQYNTVPVKLAPSNNSS